MAGNNVFAEVNRDARGGRTDDRPKLPADGGLNHSEPCDFPTKERAAFQLPWPLAFIALAVRASPFFSM